MYLFKVFPYKFIRESLSELLLRPSFVDLCQHWKSRAVSMEMEDIYDGQVWNDFRSVSGEHFLVVVLVWAS